MEYLILQVEKNSLTVGHFGITRRAEELIGAATLPLDEEHTLPETIRGIASRITGSPRVILCLPATMFAQRLVSLPFTDLRKVREVLPAQLQGEIALPVEELVIDVMPAGDGSFLVLWARSAEIAEAVALFREAGLEPQVVTSRPFALASLPQLPPSGAFLDGTVLALITNGALTYYRAEEQPLTADMAAATLSMLELSGGELPPLLGIFADGDQWQEGDSPVPLPVKHMTAPAGAEQLFTSDEQYRMLAGLYAVAKASHNRVLPDFRQGELAWTAGNASTQRSLRVTAILAALLVILLFTAKGFQYRAVAADLESLNKAIAGQYREIFPTRAKAVDEVAEIKGEIRKLAGVEAGGSFLDILKKLADAKGSTINGLYEAELEGRSLRIKGDARSAQVVNEFRSQLTPLMSSVELGEVKSRPDGMVTFSMTGTVKEGK